MLKITKNQGSIQVTASESGFYPFDGTITFPTNSLFTATSANTDMITFKSTSNGDVQFVGNYKDITISGRSYDTKQKFLTAFSNLANQGSVDAYTKAETDAKLNNKLTAKTNANYALFISSYSNDDANSSVALYNSSVKGMNDVAIGWASTLDKNGVHNLAMLNQARANGSNNIAIGDQRRCDGSYNIGIGSGEMNSVDVLGAGNVCIGAYSEAHTPTPNNAAVNESVAIGSNANASNDYCTVIGSDARSKSNNGIAVGYYASIDTNSNNGIAVGSDARARGRNSVAIGYSSEATIDEPLVINAGYKTVDNVVQPLTVLQSDATGKLSILKGDGTDERIVIQDALSAGGSGGTVDAYTKTETDNLLNAKQNTLTAGTGITIDENNTISLSGATPEYNIGLNHVYIGNEVADHFEIATTPFAIGATDVTNSRGESVPMPYLQGDNDGKISIPLGDGTSDTMCLQDEIAALKNAGGTGGSANPYVNVKGVNESATIADDVLFGIAIGERTEVTKDEGIAVGGQSKAKGRWCVSVGSHSTCIGDSTVAIGDSANAMSTNAVAIGSSAMALIENSVAIGKNAHAMSNMPLVINAGGDGNNVLPMIQGDANGKISIPLGDGTASVMCLQDEIEALKNAGGSGGGSANPLVAVKGTDSATITDTVTEAVAIGSRAKVTEELSVAIGAAKALSGHCVAIGGGANATKMSSIAIGDGACAQAHMFDVAIGFHAATTDTKPLEINAGYKTVGGATTPLTVLQSDSTGKLSILKGGDSDERIVISDEITALKAEITTLKAEIAALKGGASTGDSTGE